MEVAQQVGGRGMGFHVLMSLGYCRRLEEHLEKDDLAVWPELGDAARSTVATFMC